MAKDKIENKYLLALNLTGVIIIACVVISAYFTTLENGYGILCIGFSGVLLVVNFLFDFQLGLAPSLSKDNSRGNKIERYLILGLAVMCLVYALRHILYQGIILG